MSVSWLEVSGSPAVARLAQTLPELLFNVDIQKT